MHAHTIPAGQHTENKQAIFDIFEDFYNSAQLSLSFR
jgi:hypothetical protein